MTPQKLQTLIGLGREQRHVEFKGPFARTEKATFAKVVRAVLGMANKPDGGVVVIGVEDNGIALRPVGLTNDQLASWKHDDVSAGLGAYADPYVDVEVGRVDLDGKQFVAIEVREFTELPVLCKRDYPDVLRNGALYVRRRGKNETLEVPSHVEMREVIERAAEIRARAMIRTASRIGATGAGGTPQAGEAAFKHEAADLL